jgi:hypothetical protein
MAGTKPTSRIKRPMQIAQIKYGCQCGWSVPQYATTCPWKNEPTSTESTSNVIRNDVAADLALQTRTVLTRS